MIMRVSWGRVRPGGWPEFEQKYREVVLAKTENMRGLKGRWLCQDFDEPDAGFAISLWEKREDIDAYMASDLYKEIAKELGDTFIDDYWTKHAQIGLSYQVR